MQRHSETDLSGMGSLEKTSNLGVLQSEVHRQWLQMQPERSKVQVISSLLKTEATSVMCWNPGDGKCQVSISGSFS